MDKKAIGLVVAIAFMACNLRAPITAIGPLVDIIRLDLGVSYGTIGFITTIPLLTFAVCSPFINGVSKTIGIKNLVWISLLLILTGELIRSYTNFAGVFLGTFVLGSGIGIGNVLLPAIIKLKFPQKIGLVTAIFTTFMAVFAGIGAGTGVPLTEGLHLGWRNTLAVWAILAVITMLVWLPQLAGNRFARKQAFNNTNVVNTLPLKPLYKSALAWHITFFMGIQSFLFYCFVAWLPSMLQSKGFSVIDSGYFVLIFQLISVPAAFFTPILYDKSKNQVLWIYIMCAFYVVGYFAFWLAQSMWLIYAGLTLIALAMGASISLAMFFMAQKVSTVETATALSGMAQAIGYLFAAVGPTLIGFLFDMTASWTIPIWIFIVLSMILLLNGIKAVKANSL